MQKYLSGLALSAAFLVPLPSAHAGTCEIDPEATFEYTGMDGSYAQVHMKLTAPIRCEDEAPCETASALGLVGGHCTGASAFLGLEWENPQTSSCSVWHARIAHGSSPAPELTLEHVGQVTPGHRYKGWYEAAMRINGCEADPSPNWQQQIIKRDGPTGYISIPPAIAGVRLWDSGFDAQNRLVVGQNIQIMPEVLAVQQTNTITALVEGPGIPKRRIVLYGDGHTLAQSISGIIPTESGVLSITIEVSGKRDANEEEEEDWIILSEPFQIPINAEPCPAEGMLAYMDPNADCSGDVSDAGESKKEEKEEDSGCSAAGAGLSLIGMIPFALLCWKRREN